MNAKHLKFIFLAGFMCINSHQSMALNCGDVITTNTTLTTDLHCDSSTGFDALTIGADNITLNLNGHTISGTNEIRGISVSLRHKVRIKGNGGALKGFLAGINIVQADSTQVFDTLFYDMPIGLWISSGNDTLIENNDFIYMQSAGVYIANHTEGSSANRNTINNNNFYKNNDAISLCGKNSIENTISNNLIWKSHRFGIHLMHSDQNIIQYNDILDTNEDAIQLDFSSYNQIISNTLKGGINGLEINAYSFGSCHESRNIQSIKNVYKGNHTFEFELGIVLGNSHTKSSLVSSNMLNNNKIYNNQTGLFFNSEAHNNNATANAYTGTITPIVDSGLNNNY